MSAFEAASKFVVVEIDERELHHVPSEIQAKRLELLSVVEDGIIKVRTWESFEPEVDEGDPHKNALSERKRDFTKIVNDTLLGELKGVFNFDLHIGSKVTYEADFEKFAWRKLKNVDSLIAYLESREYSTSIGKKSYHSWGDWIRGIFSYFHSWGNWIRGMPSITHSFKVVTSVVYTTSPTEITLTCEPKSDGSVKVDKTLSPTVTGEAKFDRSKVDTQVVNLMIDTGIAYGCVEVFVDKSGKMKVEAIEVFAGTMTLKQPSRTSAGDASSKNWLDDSQTNEEIVRWRKLVGEHWDEIERQKSYVSSLLKFLGRCSVDQEEDSRPPTSSATSTTTELLDLQENDSLALELKEKYGESEEKSELKEECTRQKEVIAGLKTKISTLETMADLEKRQKEGMTDLEKRRQETMADLEKRLGAQIKESHDSAMYTMSLRLDKITQQVSLSRPNTEDGQARASSQRIPRIPRASRQGEHQEASIPSRTSPTEGDNLVEDRYLASGAYGSVYLHFDSHASEMVAVKIIHIGPVDSQDSRNILWRFKLIRNEIAVMERLNHVRIVKYIRSEIRADSFCIYMEYMCGGSVRNQLDKEGCLGEATTKKYTRQILEGLDYLHKEGIIHRDIKGSNILCDGQGNVKLADFGISKLLGALETMNENRARTGTGENTGIAGTAHWMAPEVIRGEKYGQRADIWSTGITMIEMLTTHPPLYNCEINQAMYIIATSTKPSYLLDDPTISRDAKNFLELTFQPKEERHTAEELLQDSWLQT